MTVPGDDITRVELMEILSTGNEKDYETYQYEPSVKAYEEMPERFVKADSADVDVYTGAPIAVRNLNRLLPGPSIMQKVE